MEKILSQAVTRPAATRVFLLDDKGGNGERAWQRGCFLGVTIGDVIARGGVQAPFKASLVRISQPVSQAASTF